jgi:hypothetical protein
MFLGQIFEAERSAKDAQIDAARAVVDAKEAEVRNLHHQ